MITLILTNKNIERDPIILDLYEDSWSFSVRLDTVGNSIENYLEIFNLEKTLNDIPNVVSTFNLLKSIDPEDINNVIIVSNEVELFNSSNFGQTIFRGIFLQFLRLGEGINDMQAHEGINLIIKFSNYSYPVVNSEQNLIPEEG